MRKTKKSVEKNVSSGDFDIEKTCRSNRLLKNLREVVQSHQNKIASEFGMSIIHLIEAEYDEMLNCLELLIKEYPKIPLLHLRIAEFFIHKADYEQAIPHLEEISELDFDDLTAKIWLCFCYYKVNNNKKASTCLDELREDIFALRTTNNNWL